MDDLDVICAMTSDFRKLWESLLHSALEHQNTAGSCLYAAMLLSTSLAKFGGASTRVCGGDGRDGGLRGLDGVLHGHYWVEGQTMQGNAFVADVTADQFGYGIVVVLPLQAGRAVYRPGDQSIVDEHVAQEGARCAAMEFE